MAMFLRAKYGAAIEEVLRWAVRQKKTVVKDVGSLDARRVCEWSSEFGATADDISRVDGVESFGRFVCLFGGFHHGRCK